MSHSIKWHSDTKYDITMGRFLLFTVLIVYNWKIAYCSEVWSRNDFINVFERSLLLSMLNLFVTLNHKTSLKCQFVFI